MLNISNVYSKLHLCLLSLCKDSLITFSNAIHILNEENL